MSNQYTDIDILDSTLSDLSDDHHHQIGDNVADNNDDGEFFSPVEILPEATEEQQATMSEFVKAPSREGWLELVEMMRVQREQQLMEFYNQSDPPVVDVGVDLSRLRTTTSSNNNVVSPNRRDGPPDPPIEEEDDMGGWTMRAKEKMTRYQEQECHENEEVSEHLLKHSSNDPDNIEVTSVGVTSYPRSPRKWLMKQSTCCIFVLGFAIGTIVIVALSFTFDRTPSQEIKHLESLHLRGRDVDNNNNDTTNEVEQLMANFCDGCQWRTQPFNCGQRVRWEMKEYNMTKDEAMVNNIKDCMKPSDDTDANP